MARADPFSQKDVEGRALHFAAKGEPKAGADDAERTPLALMITAVGAENVRCLRDLAGADKPEEFLRNLIGLIYAYRQKKLAEDQERPAAVAEALKLLLNQELAAFRAFQSAPMSVREIACRALGRPEPSGKGINQLRNEIEHLEQQKVPHRRQRLTPELIDHVRLLDLLAYEFSQFLREYQDKRRIWLEYALEASGEPPPASNGKAWLDELMLAAGLT